MNAMMPQATLMVFQIASVHALLVANGTETLMEQPGLAACADAGAGTGVYFSVFNPGQQNPLYLTPSQ
jgi:hypothetical protein